MERRLQDIKLLVMDVDGVLTDGTIFVGNFDDEYRAFNAQDGLGVVLWHRAGGLSAIITSKSSAAVRRRARELQIPKVFQRVKDKKKAFEKILAQYRLAPENACYIGDDLIDIPVLKAAGFGVTVPDAPAEVQRVAQYVTKRPAGKGAVRETVEYILKAQQQWDALVKDFEA